MQRCLHLARLGLGNVAPNPLVGAVVVHDHKIIAEGYHHSFGGPHAEVVALGKITDHKVLKKSTLFVNLEPCTHTGKTPPCTSLIIEKGIKEVVIANRDPFPQVNGKGIAKLQNAGVKVTSGILEAEGAFLNRRFFTFHTKKRPFIILKWAQSADGFMATLPDTSRSSEQRPGAKAGILWISNPVSRMMVHKWRSEEQSILVGNRTVKHDNPRLNVRGLEGKDPLRVIIDPQLKLTSSHRVFNKTGTTWVVNRVRNEVIGNIHYVKINNKSSLIQELLEKLYIENILSVLVEGGAATLIHFIESGFWDEARIFTSPVVMNDGLSAPFFKGIPLEQHDVAGDLLNIYLNPAAN